MIRMTDGARALARARALAARLADPDDIRQTYAAFFEGCNAELYATSRQQLADSVRRASILIVPAAIRWCLAHSALTGEWRLTMFDIRDALLILDEVPCITDRSGDDVHGQLIQLDGNEIYGSNVMERDGVLRPSSHLLGRIDGPVEPGSAALLVALDRGLLRTVKAKRRRVYFVALP